MEGMTWQVSLRISTAGWSHHFCFVGSYSKSGPWNVTSPMIAARHLTTMTICERATVVASRLPSQNLSRPSTFTESLTFHSLPFQVIMSDTLERDPGFCSGGEDDDIEAEDGIHSPTDASEDSVDVKVQAISLRNKNKRKSAEPRRVDTDLPAKKRKIDLLAVKNEKEEPRNCSPFRPWSASPSSQNESSRYSQSVICVKNEVDPQSAKLQNDLSVVFVPRLPSPQHPPVTNHPSPVSVLPQDLSRVVRTVPKGTVKQFSETQEEPLSLVAKKRDRESDTERTPNPLLVSPALRLDKVRELPSDIRVHSEETARMWHSTIVLPSVDLRRSNTPKDKDKFSVINRVRNCKTFGDKKVKSVSDNKLKTDDNSHQSDNKFGIDTLLSSSKSDGRLNTSATTKPSQGGQQRNYKNMTRERRIEANARERTRVHTISAAFDTLRHSIPAYSHNQKLSKLSVLRIACSYIMTLSRLAGYDYSKDQSQPEISNCVENVSKTIQTEGKIRKKKDD